MTAMTIAPRRTSVLVPLIKRQLTDGYKAVEKAGKPYFYEAGKLLHECKTRYMEDKSNGIGKYSAWPLFLLNHFKGADGNDLKRQVADRYIDGYIAVTAMPAGGHAPTLRELTDKRHPNHVDHVPDSKQTITFKTPVKLDTKRLAANDERARQMRDAAEMEADAYDAEIKVLRALGKKLVLAGFRQLSLKLHPDHGGDTVSFNRLKHVRKALEDAMDETIS